METRTETQRELMATLVKNNSRPIINTGEVEVMGRPTHEVVRHSDGEIVHKGSGQQCANYLFENNGKGIMSRRINY